MVTVPVLALSVMSAAAALPPAATSEAAPVHAPVPAPTVTGALRSQFDPPTARCGGAAPAEILVCGHASDRFRIDPAVLSAIRAREAPPAKPELTADMAAATGCVGPQACGGDYIPLVGMALVVARAAALAASGDDWRDALRTHEDEYRLYQQAEARKAKDRRPRFGIGVAK